MVPVKVRCLDAHRETKLAIGHGAAVLGLTPHMPGGSGVSGEDLIASIWRSLPAGVASFLLTDSTHASEITAQQKRCRTTAVQVCHQVSGEVQEKLRVALPGIVIVQVAQLWGPEPVKEARRMACTADAILLDSGGPGLPVAEPGGAEPVDDWAVSKAVREAVTVPVLLAGGLGPDNVRSAVEEVRPFGVGVCRGVRTDGRLDGVKLKRFMAALA